MTYYVGVGESVACGSGCAESHRYTHRKRLKANFASVQENKVKVDTVKTCIKRTSTGNDRFIQVPQNKEITKER